MTDIFKPGMTVKTRDGREARIYATDGGRDGNHVHGALLNHGAWLSQTWYSNGRMVKSDECPEDLMPPKKELWVHVYRDGTGHGFRDRHTATSLTHNDVVACIRVEYQEGQFDE